MDRRNFFKGSAAAISGSIVTSSAQPKTSYSDIKRFSDGDSYVIFDWVKKNIECHGEMEFMVLHDLVDNFLGGDGMVLETPYNLVYLNEGLINKIAFIQLSEDWTIYSPSNILSMGLTSDNYTTYNFVSSRDIHSIRIFLNGSIIKPNKSNILIIEKLLVPAEFIGVRDTTLTKFVVNDGFSGINVVPL